MKLLTFIASLTLILIYTPLVTTASPSLTEGNSLAISSIKYGNDKVIASNLIVISPSPFSVMNIKSINKIVNKMIELDISISNNTTLANNMTKVRFVKLMSFV